MSNPAAPPATIEDLMASLFKESIFDLPAAARLAIKKIQEEAQTEDAPGNFDVIVHSNYVYVSGTADQ